MSNRASMGVRARLLAGLLVTGIMLIGCQGRAGSPVAPSVALGNGSAAQGPSMVCRGGQGGFPCWAPGQRPPIGPQPGGLVAYDEAVSGDLADSLPSTFVGSVGVGANTVTGTTFASNDGGLSFDADSFSFDVPAGVTVTEMVLEWSLTAVPDVSSAQMSYDLQMDENSLQFVVVDLLSSTPPFTTVTEASGSQSLIAAALPLSVGSYDMVHQLFGIGGLGPGPRTWNATYTWTITAIPSSAIDVSFTVTPEFNDFLLDFSVTNNIGPGEEIYWFGVFLESGSDIPSFGIPTGWADAGGGATYNNNWSTDPAGPYTIVFGNTLTGFIARDNSSTDPPQLMDWIALTVSGETFTGTAMQAAPVP